MRVLVHIEDVPHTQLAHRQHQAVRAARGSQLIGCGGHRLVCCAKIERVPNEKSRQAEVGLVLAHFVSFAARKSGRAQGVVESESLVQFCIDPELRSGPQSHTEV